MNDITYAFSGNLDKCYSMEVYVLAGFHIRVTKKVGLFWWMSPSLWTLCSVIARRLDFIKRYTTRGSKQCCYVQSRSQW